VLTISEASSRDLQHYYGLAPERISVIHLAADPQFSPAEENDATLRERYGLGQAPLILFVGKFSRRRNLPALVEAFARLVHQQQLPHTLILVGVNHLHLPILELARQLGVGERVIHTDFIQDADLVRLYRLADLFIYPSEMEGFGLPLVEAMASGTPVITLRRPVLVEVAAEAAYYANAGTPEDLHAAMAAVLTDRTMHDDLRRRGLERARVFSWANTARQTMDVLYSVVEERHHVYQQRG
jgi:glycosyltransferase involved in cell wall biosynthesis